MNDTTVNIGILKKSIFKGILAFLILLSLYFLILTLISGWSFTLEQFSQFWYYTVSLALGFGIQFSLYSYLRDAARQKVSTGQLVTTGTTSTAAMISCCAHYLTNILPILGVTGIITFITQYQVQFFWVGLIFNLFGILYIGNKVIKITGLKISKTTVFYSSLLAVVLLFFFLNSVSINISPNNTNKAGAVSGSVKTDSNLKTQESNEGTISVSVTAQSLGNSSPTWNFGVDLNTHSGSIDTDLVTVSQLIDGQGKLYKPISWEGSVPGGHHRSGVLKFNPILPRPKSIELKIKNIGGIPERRFKWDL